MRFFKHISIRHKHYSTLPLLTIFYKATHQFLHPCMKLHCTIVLVHMYQNTVITYGLPSEYNYPFKASN